MIVEVVEADQRIESGLDETVDVDALTAAAFTVMPRLVRVIVPVGCRPR